MSDTPRIANWRRILQRAALAERAGKARRAAKEGAQIFALAQMMKKNRTTAPLTKPEGRV